ncbi:MAG: T9SS type A sorting domain-containing protein [Bacteroidia bacterium]|nr:T9SS type A sorting domain-containing protein [Bacteroidia bacterium]
MSGAQDLYRRPRTPPCGMMGGGVGMTLNPEKGWTFTAPTHGEVTVTLEASGNSPLHLFVYEGSIGNPCTGQTPNLECKGESQASPPFISTASVTFCVRPNTTYYVFVEGSNTASYTNLQVSAITQSGQCGTSATMAVKDASMRLHTKGGNLYIECPLSMGSKSVLIYDCMGRLVYESTFIDEKLEIDANQWGKGLYHAVVQEGTHEVVSQAFLLGQ